MRRFLARSLVAVALAACDGPGPNTDAGVPDARVALDAGSAPAPSDAGSSDAGTDAGLPPLRDDAVSPPWSWHERAERIIDRVTLADAFAARGYTLPSGAYVYAARITDGVAQPAYELFEAGGGAFGVDFWPASTIKLLAGVAALEFVGERGFTGAARVTWDSGYGDVLADIIDRAIRDSSNPDYDRTLRVAGLDWINTTFLTADRGFPTVVLTSSYGGLPVRDVSGLTITEGGASDYVPARTTSGDYGRNDTSLFDLVEGLRRVMQHEELPAAHRFALGDADGASLRDALCGSTVKYFGAGARAVLGADARICNKYGYVPSSQCLDHALLESADGSERYLLAAAVPASSTCGARLSEIAEETLLALRAAPAATPLQLDAGAPIVIQLDDLGSAGGARSVRLTVGAEGVDRVRVSVNRQPAEELTGAGRFVVERTFASGGDHLVTVRAFAGATPIGYRAARMTIPEP